MKYTEVYNLLYKTAQEVSPVIQNTGASARNPLAWINRPSDEDRLVENLNQNAINTIIANNYDVPAEPAPTGRVKYFNGVVNGKRVFAANNNDNMPLEPQINAAANGQGRNITIRKSK